MKIIYINKRVLHRIIGIALILIIMMALAVFKYKSMPVLSLAITDKIIGIDPGHGGVDPGAVGISGIKEDEINLMIGLKLKRLIEQSGGIAVITRKDQQGLYTERSKSLKEMKKEDLENRKNIIEKGNCNIFLTIHLNSFQDSRYYGAQTFYKPDCNESMKLANFIQEELKEVLDKDNHRLPQEREDIYLLNEINTPAVLVECGFLSNPKEEKLLASDKYQEKIAWAIYRGIIRYFEEKNRDYSFNCG
ncbi:N-acetylmuramoyl-L-alanine amidase CwlD [Clostridium sp. Cult3]|uniref:N-acetylmuramoyl-L-alanine amidase CwlD n=1 Tax=Clostridium sp. Cult3 TaxID=2079004 RepID=UPI001F01D91B